MGERDLHFGFQAVREVAAFSQVANAFLGRDRKARRHRQANPGHLGQVGALAANNGLVAAAGAIVTGTAAEGIDLLVHVSGLFPELAG